LRGSNNSDIICWKTITGRRAVRAVPMSMPGSCLAILKWSSICPANRALRGADVTSQI